MNNCKEIREMISEYIDKELKPGSIHKFEKHIEKCPACRMEYEELKQVSDLCRNMSDAELPDDFKTGLYNKLNIDIKDNNLTILGRFRTSLGGINRYSKYIATAAACLLIAFLAKGFLDVPFRFDKPSLNSMSAGNTAAVEKSADAAMDTNGSKSVSQKSAAGQQPQNQQNKGTQQGTVQQFGYALADSMTQEKGITANSDAAPAAGGPASSSSPVSSSVPEAPSASAFSTSRAPSAAPTSVPASVPSSAAFLIPETSASTESAPETSPRAATASLTGSATAAGSLPVSTPAPSPAAEVKSTTFAGDSAAKASGISRSGYSSKGSYIEIRLSNSQNSFSDSLIEKIKEMALEYNQINAVMYGKVVTDSPENASAIQKPNTIEIRIEEDKDQEFLNKLNNLIINEEGKITVSEIPGSETPDINKDKTDTSVKTQEEQAKPRYTVIIIIFP